MRNKQGEQIIKQIAKLNGMSVEAVRSEMEIAIKEAYNNPDTHQKWRELFGEGVLPTPEEFIGTITKEVKSSFGSK